MPFRDRRDAGRRLVGRLSAFRDQDVVVLGVPRGGVPVADEVARALHVPLDVIVVRKLRVPYQREMVFGAIGEYGVTVVDKDLMGRAFVSTAERKRVTLEARDELSRSLARYRKEFPRVPLSGRTAVIVDDGVATGATAHAACAIVRRQGAARVVYAAPVGSCLPVRALGASADNVVCIETPELFHSVRQWYQHFEEVTEAQVCALLADAAPLRSRPGSPPPVPH
ncbi:phosphoribosyltransferase [Nocardia brasiliensis]|uniref:phosphoribosyltransferase n=1 Tax=Nocardia brasiliensis TaxID=37326 RepID=UPI00366C4C8C